MKQYAKHLIIFLVACSVGILVFSGWRLLQFSEKYYSINSSAIKSPSDFQAPPIELMPMIERYNFTAFSTPDEFEGEYFEEADARLYAPLKGESVFLLGKSPTFDSEDVKPRYRLRVEEYLTPQLALKRAEEYTAEGSDEE